jgi:hypothetical protein
MRLGDDAVVVSEAQVLAIIEEVRAEQLAEMVEEAACAVFARAEEQLNERRNR